MDLNYLYSQQQKALIRASGTGSRLDRTRHCATADLFDHRIRSFRVSKGLPPIAALPHRGCCAGEQA